MLKKMLLALTFFISSSANISSQTIVLQNGLNGYNGCKDTYLRTSNMGTQYLHDNFSNEKEIVTAR